MDKAQRKAVLAQQAADIAAAVFAYASSISDNTLKEQVNYPLSYLQREKDELLGPACANIRNASNANLAALAPFGITAALLISGRVYTVKFGPFLENLFSDNEMVDLFCSGLASCMRYIQNPNDPVYHEAVKKVESNEELIKI
ncbi:MAG: hypothetical protein HYX40_02735 [Sphingobacteriales bacterium]|nr:hypothetical protein [Sphingobacteriales bacterium]